MTIVALSVREIAIFLHFLLQSWKNQQICQPEILLFCLFMYYFCILCWEDLKCNREGHENVYWVLREGKVSFLDPKWFTEKLITRGREEIMIQKHYSTESSLAQVLYYILQIYWFIFFYCCCCSWVLADMDRWISSFSDITNWKICFWHLLYLSDYKWSLLDKGYIGSSRPDRPLEFFSSLLPGTSSCHIWLREPSKKEKRNAWDGISNRHASLILLRVPISIERKSSK